MVISLHAKCQMSTILDFWKRKNKIITVLMATLAKSGMSWNWGLGRPIEFLKSLASRNLLVFSCGHTTRHPRHLLLHQTYLQTQLLSRRWVLWNFYTRLKKTEGRRNLSGKKHSYKCCHNLGFKGISESKPKDCNKDNQVMDYSIQKVRSIWPENYDTIQLMQPKYLTNAPYKEENYFLK